MKRLTLLWLALAGSTAFAQTTLPPAGRLLASNCFQCHGTDGKGPGFDRLAGKNANEIYEEMKNFQAGQEGNGIMAKHAWIYTDEQLHALAGWLSQQTLTARSAR